VFGSDNDVDVLRSIGISSISAVVSSRKESNGALPEKLLASSEVEGPPCIIMLGGSELDNPPQIRLRLEGARLARSLLSSSRFNR